MKKSCPSVSELFLIESENGQYLMTSKQTEALEKIGVNAVIDSSWSKLILSHNYNILEFIPLSVKVIWRFVNIILCFGKPKKIKDYV